MKKDKVKLEPKKAKDQSEKKSCDRNASPTKDELQRDVDYLRACLQKRNDFIDKQFYMINHLTEMVRQIAMPRV
jgi:hypothetical protein